MTDITIITILNVILLAIGIFKIKQIDSLEKMVINDKVWLYISWEACLLLYSLCGIVYPISLKLNAYLYIVLFWMFYLIGSKVAKQICIKKGINIEKKEITYRQNERLNFSLLFFISLIGTALYVLVVHNQNPNTILGITRGVKVNGLATLFLIFSSSSLIIWLYELLYSITNKKRIKLYGIISAFLYNIPGIVISGRDALMIFIISSLIIIVYSLTYLKKNKLLTQKVKSRIKNITIISLIAIVAYLLLISSIRYGKNDDSVLTMFEWVSGATFPKYLTFIYKYNGAFGKLILNVVFYYTSQFSKLALVFENYTGPYQFGLYQLHYVARLLSNSFGIDITAVSNSMSDICNYYNLSGLKVLWGTVIEYSIYDFGKIGSLIYAFVFGYIVKYRVIKNNNKAHELNIVALALICVAMFTTVEISPLYDYFFVFPVAWLIIIKLFSKKYKK